MDLVLRSRVLWAAAVGFGGCAAAGLLGPELGATDAVVYALALAALSAGFVPLFLSGLAGSRREALPGTRSPAPEGGAVRQGTGEPPPPQPAGGGAQPTSIRGTFFGPPGPTGEPLTPAEVRVADALTRGMTNQEIADALTISNASVMAHVRALYVKLGVADRDALVGALLRDPEFAVGLPPRGRRPPS